jgi:uncharacterized membrane protein YhaH (DUF805 family)
MPSTPAFGRRGATQAAAAQAPRAPGSPLPAETNGFDLRTFLFSFDGRIPRRWWWLGQFGICIVMETISQLSRMVSASVDHAHPVSPASLLGLLLVVIGMLIALVLFAWAGVAITVKRWHDRNWSWVWALLGLVPIIGWTWQGIECGFLEGTLGPNRYGPSPKGIQGVIYATA